MLRAQQGLERARYLTTPRVETILYLALRLEKPLLIEGPAGAGKTEIGKVLAETLHTEMVRLQCYEGLDEAKALYEWNYQKQLLRIQADRTEDLEWSDVTQHIFSREYLLERPLLRAITTPRKVVLLIDEIDKADEEFEAFLLEVLSDFQVSIPELGTVAARHRPAVVLTSNRTRELSDALKKSSVRSSLSRFPISTPSCGITWQALSTTCASSICAKRRALPKRSTGHARCAPWASRNWMRRRSAKPLRSS